MEKANPSFELFPHCVKPGGELQNLKITCFCVYVSWYTNRVEHIRDLEVELKPKSFCIEYAGRLFGHAYSKHTLRMRTIKLEDPMQDMRA